MDVFVLVKNLCSEDRDVAIVHLSFIPSFDSRIIDMKNLMVILAIASILMHFLHVTHCLNSIKKVSEIPLEKAMNLMSIDDDMYCRYTLILPIQIVTSDVDECDQWSVAKTSVPSFTDFSN